MLTRGLHSKSAAGQAGPQPSTQLRARRGLIYRHQLIVRVTHWVNLACMVILLMSGLMIFNGWPALYWGHISQNFRSNGTHHPSNPEYQALASKDFVDWRLEIGGLVDRPMGLSLKDIRAMPSVTQITRHDCVEGWSCIGKWTGVPLREMLASAGVQKRARYAVFFCYDTLPGASEPYYESIGLDQVNLPETILAYEMNNQTLSIPYGAPLRLRLGRQLGYKMAKYLRRIELVESFTHIEGGHGGFYEDNGYEWYAGI